MVLSVVVVVVKSPPLTRLNVLLTINFDYSLHPHHDNFNSWMDDDAWESRICLVYFSLALFILFTPIFIFLFFYFFF